jgi:hypothetical protein
MWRYALALSVVSFFLLPSLAQAQFKDGDYELTLSGSGNNDHDFRTGSASVNGSLGYFTSKELEIALRQGVIWGDGGSSWNGDTRLAVDYHFDLGNRLVPFVGANVGYLYGDDINDEWVAGPEVGIKYFLNDTTFIQVMASYEFALCEGLDQGAFFYGLGLGVRL